jgi:hypothetical protein
MIRRVCYALVMTVALLGALVLPTAPVASAVPYQCSIAMPGTVAIGSPVTQITARQQANCETSDSVWASWKVRRISFGQYSLLAFYHPNLNYSNPSSLTDTVRFDRWDTYGTYLAQPSSAYNDHDAPLTQNTVSYVVKARSGLSIWSSRAGQNVTLRASTRYYNILTNSFLPWKHEKVTFQYKACARCAWTHLQNVSTNSAGGASFTFSFPAARSYRAISASNNTIWGRTSVVITR